MLRRMKFGRRPLRIFLTDSGIYGFCLCSTSSGPGQRSNTLLEALRVLPGVVQFFLLFFRPRILLECPIWCSSRATTNCYHSGKRHNWDFSRVASSVTFLGRNIGYSASWERCQEGHNFHPLADGGKRGVAEVPSPRLRGGAGHSEGTEVVHFLTSSFPTSGIAYCGCFSSGRVHSNLVESFKCTEQNLPVTLSFS